MGKSFINITEERTKMEATIPEAMTMVSHGLINVALTAEREDGVDRNDVLAQIFVGVMNDENFNRKAVKKLIKEKQKNYDRLFGEDGVCTKDMNIVKELEELADKANATNDAEELITIMVRVAELAQKVEDSKKAKGASNE